MQLTFAGYTFRFWLLTTANRYEPEAFTVEETPGGFLARSEQYSFGEGSGAAAGSFEVRFTQRSGQVVWVASASHSEPIKGLRLSVEPFPSGTVILPFEEVELKEGDPGRCWIYPGGYYPMRHISSTGTSPSSGPVRDWAAPFALIQAPGGWLALSAPEYPPRVKKMWLYRKENNLILHLYSEADACCRTTEYRSPEWRLEQVTEWQSFVSAHSAWMSQSFQIPRFEDRASTQSWLKEIGLVAILHGQTHDGKICHTYADMSATLRALASRFPPARTLVKLVGFEGHIDRHWPDVSPAADLGGTAGWQDLISTAHGLGYRLIPHLNVWGASFENPRTRDLLAHQILDPEGRASTWTYDYDQDEIAEEIMAYISPAAPEWRAVQVQRIRELVDGGIDAIYLDQTGTFINDLRHDHFAGLRALYADLAQAFPHTQFAGEAPNHELTTSLVSLVCGISTVRSERLAEMYRLLFGAYIRQYGYNLPPELYRGVWGAPTQVRENWSREAFLDYEARSERVHGIPSLNLTDRRIDLTSDLVESVLERARHYRMA